ncbi:uncharacterized protein LACBIDRAFT_332245 [Laccaria bicolor S238N-H82]|uniref:Predicted protein n=1 Tax=Laccaria bicolor (strain S238N-H82 / ATCC MYA-4686) TaxID=486041 RepID=B0DS30_LACBS|nr:uncharacterized protein LACBIDRAFT_332245 [Laccaria bicolor S238N-H82]EDR02719.1 predicted protein [Laccaria bicolor S238N-H82]|eukprot:XP_001886763.1 predicted protein [Laccaria bicolor S238N-H82]
MIQVCTGGWNVPTFGTTTSHTPIERELTSCERNGYRRWEGSFSFVGCVFTWFLSGSLMVQTYDYFGAYDIKGDALFIKSIDTINVCHFYRLERACDWMGRVNRFLGLFGISSHEYSPHGVRLGLPFRVLHSASFLRLLALMQFVASIVRGVLVWLSGTFVCDFFIVATMTTLLVRAKLESSLKSTQRLLDRLIIIALETAAVTLVVALVQLIFYVKFPTNGRQQVSVMYILGGLYSNALLAVLNGRKRSRGRLAEPTLSIHFEQKTTLPGSLSGSHNEGSEV